MQEPAKKTIYLFSSVPPDRPNYKRGVLNALCYPPGHLTELSYQKSYIEPSLVAQAKSLKGRSAVIVYIDYKLDSDHDFIPIRRSTIAQLAPKEEAQSYSPSTRFYARIELLDLIPFEESWNQIIRDTPGRPVPHREGWQPGNDFFVLEAEDPFPQSCERSQRDIWDHLVERVAKSRRLEDCIFLATGHLRDFRTGRECRFGWFRGTQEKCYQVRPNRIYRMDLRIFDQRHSPDTNQEITVRSSSDLLSVSQAFPTVVGGAVDHDLLIVCKRTLEKTLATLVVDVHGRPKLSETERPLSKPEDQPQPSSAVICAKPQYLISISFSRSFIVFMLVLILGGAFLTGTSKDFYEDMSVANPVTWALLSKVSGALLLALAAILGLRKLPSGGFGT